MARINRPGRARAEGWRELHRSTDLLEARAVATSIAAMEFDVRLTPVGRPRVEFDDSTDGLDGGAAAEDSTGPYCIEVLEVDWPALADVLAEIIDEQREFDAWADRRAQQRRAKLFIVLSAAGIVQVLAIWHLIES